MGLKIQIEQTEASYGIPLPVHATPGSAGADLYAVIEEPLTLLPGDRVLISTGLKMSLPMGYEAQIRSRSGLAWKNGLIVLNAPATIDSDYRGEVKVILANLGQEPFVIERGMRIAQLVIAKHETIDWQPVESLDSTQRNEGGFGSTGVQVA